MNEEKQRKMGRKYRKEIMGRRIEKEIAQRDVKTEKRRHLKRAEPVFINCSSALF